MWLYSSDQKLRLTGHCSHYIFHIYHQLFIHFITTKSSLIPPHTPDDRQPTARLPATPTSPFSKGLADTVYRLVRVPKSKIINKLKFFAPTAQFNAWIKIIIKLFFSRFFLVVNFFCRIPPIDARLPPPPPSIPSISFVMKIFLQNLVFHQYLGSYFTETDNIRLYLAEDSSFHSEKNISNFFFVLIIKYFKLGLPENTNFQG